MKFMNIFYKCENIIEDKVLACKWVIKPVLEISIIYFIALLSLFRANFNYIDDLGRVAQGYRNWINWSRFILQELSVLINTQKILTDISPLTQLIAILIIALAGVIIIYTFTGKKTVQLSMIAAVVPLGLSPWFLECFSYKFDSPYMALSVLASVIPFIFWQKDFHKFIGLSVLGILVMDTTYQAASGIYIIEVLFLYFYKWMYGTRAKDCVIWLSSAAGSYVMAMIIYRFALMRPATDYVSTNSVGAKSLPYLLIHNATQYLNTIYFDCNKTWVILFVLIAISFIILTIFKSRKNKILTFLVALGIVIISAVLSYGGYLALAKPLYAPRALYGFSFYVSILMVMSVAMLQRGYFIKLLIMMMAWCMIILSCTYGNALAEQKRYTDFRVQMVINDLNRVTAYNLKQKYAVQINGNIGKAPAVERMQQKWPALRRLVPSTFGSDWYWNQFYFFNYFKLNADKWDKKKGDMKEMNLPVIVDSRYHLIQADDTHVMIILR